jgi:hypothetical protein
MAGKKMDVKRFISELRAERKDIEHAILSLERGDQLSTRATEAAAESVIEIRTKELKDAL